MRKRRVHLTVAALAMLLAVAAWIWFALKPPSPLAASKTAVGGSSIVLSDLTLVNPGNDRRERQSLVISDGVIAEIGTVDSALGERASLYRGAYVLPGLIDFHMHLPPDTPLELTSYFALLFLAHGVTSVRETGDADGTAVAAAVEGIEEGEFPGPRIFACGPFVCGGPPRWSNSIVLNGTAEVEEVVGNIAGAGFHCVKAYEDLAVDQIRALEAAARQHGLPVIGHVPTALGYEEALLPEVQHFLGVPRPESLARDHIVNRISDWQDVDEARLELIVETTLRHRITNTPTLVLNRQLLHYADYEAALEDPVVRLLPRLYREAVWHPTEGLPFYRNLGEATLAKLREALAKKEELVRRLYEAGAELRVGTDVQQPFVVPGASLHQEMRLFREVGIPAEAIWEMATRKAGADLGLPMLGTIQVGAPADLLIFREDPTRDLEALASLEAVIVRGRLYSRADLAAAIETYGKHFESWTFDRISVAVTRRILDFTVERDY